jgi:hypothetical protein
MYHHSMHGSGTWNGPGCATKQACDMPGIAHVISPLVLAERLSGCSVLYVVFSPPNSRHVSCPLMEREVLFMFFMSSDSI